MKGQTRRNYKVLTTELGAEIKGLKEELSYYQNAIYELGQKKSKKVAAASQCQEGFGIAKCQVQYTLAFNYITFFMQINISTTSIGTIHRGKGHKVIEFLLSMALTIYLTTLSL